MGQFIIEVRNEFALDRRAREMKEFEEEQKEKGLSKSRIPSVRSLDRLPGREMVIPRGLGVTEFPRTVLPSWGAYDRGYSQWVGSSQVHGFRGSSWY